MERKRIIALKVNDEEAEMILKASYRDNRTISSYIRKNVLQQAKKDLKIKTED